MRILSYKFGVFLTLLFVAFSLIAQDPNRFSNQIEEIVQKKHNPDPDKKLLLFTGSSSIRMWNDIQDYFPNYNVINNGFGGSHFSDLLFFYDKLIPLHKADVLFIYEGDNDIASDKKQDTILDEARELLAKIRSDLPETKIVLISPKPSIARWEKRGEYQKLNQMLKNLADETPMVWFADVWSAMLDENGTVFQDVFLDDKLHLNKKGYDIWAEVLSGFLE